MRLLYTALSLAAVALFVPATPSSLNAAPLVSGAFNGFVPENTVARRHAFRGGGFRDGFEGHHRGGYSRLGRPGFVGAMTAAAWAGAPPVPDQGWFYTDASRTQGFRDRCPA